MHEKHDLEVVQSCHPILPVISTKIMKYTTNVQKKKTKKQKTEDSSKC